MKSKEQIRQKQELLKFVINNFRLLWEMHEQFVKNGSYLLIMNHDGDITISSETRKPSKNENCIFFRIRETRAENISRVSRLHSEFEKEKDEWLKKYKSFQYRRTSIYELVAVFSISMFIIWGVEASQPIPTSISSGNPIIFIVMSTIGLILAKLSLSLGDYLKKQKETI